MHGSGSVLAIVALVALFAIIAHRKTRMPQGSSRPESQDGPGLGNEVKALRERLHVLERITVENESSLAREIDALADKDGGTAPARESKNRGGGPGIGR